MPIIQIVYSFVKLETCKCSQISFSNVLIFFCRKLCHPELLEMGSKNNLFCSSTEIVPGFDGSFFTCELCNFSPELCNAYSKRQFIFVFNSAVFDMIPFSAIA